MFAQAVPVSLQRCQAYVKVVGLVSHAPVVAVSVSPALVVPETVGSGGVGADRARAQRRHGDDCSGEHKGERSDMTS